MVGRNHVIANYASLGALACGVHALSKSVGLLGSIGLKIRFLANPFIDILPSIAWCAAGLVLFTLGTLLPDIDSKGSTLGRYVHLPVRHRTITHTFWIVLLLGILSLKVGLLFWLTLGYFLHIFWDSFSNAGIAWFWPLSRYIHYPNGAVVKKGFRWKLYKTGEASETVFLIAACGLCVFCMGFYIISSLIAK